MEKLIVNGKHYPLWSQFVEKAKEWIGGVLEDMDDKSFITKIISIKLMPNGKDSAFFEIKGETFDCGFDVKYGGIIAGEEGWITFSGYDNHTWRIKQPEKQN